jgi:hypothetical protein
MAGHSKAKGQEPMVLALSLCEQVHRHPRTWQFSILGTLHWVFAQRFPHFFPRLCVYGCLTGGRGTTAIRVRIVDADGSPPIVEREFDAPFPDPDLVVEFGFEFYDVRFPAPDNYLLQLDAAGARIMQRTIVLEQVSEGEV